jgi:UDP-N-acetylmuramyl pentapeptide phosphotransferase/UDP-N-acetylglucosamine-1-phosphate transferase
VAFAVSLVGGRAMMVAGVWDNPDLDRKAHRAPTPTSGGVAIGMGFAAAIAIVALSPWQAWAASAGPDALLRLFLTVVAALFALLLGFVDDVRPLGPRLKFGLLCAGSFMFAIYVARAEVLPLVGPLVASVGFLGGVLGSALFIFTLVNATNFIDGMNGLAMGAGAISLATLATLGLVHGAPHVAIAGFAAAAALAGFLVWNFPGGRLFAGDAGSLFTGMLGAGLGLVLVRDAGVSPYVVVLCFFPTLADVLLTLAWRLSKGRALLAGHRDHLYQMGARLGAPPATVSLVFWAVTAHCCLIAFLASFGARIELPPPVGASFSEAMFHLAAWAASASPLLGLIVMAVVSIKVSNRLRALAAARGVDSE